MQIQQSISIHIHPSGLEGLLDAVSNPGYRCDILKLHAQVNPSKVAKQSVFFRIARWRMVMTEVHVEQSILVVISH